MKQIKSKTVEINQAVETVFYALSDFRNLKTAANDKIQNFECDYDTCSFDVSSMASVSLKITERKPFEYISIASAKEVVGGFNFIINLLFSVKGERACTLTAEANIEGNTITLMMIKKQIEKGLDMLMDGIKKGFDMQNI
jgi:hypothetical protein